MAVLLVRYLEGDDLHQYGKVAGVVAPTLHIVLGFVVISTFRIYHLTTVGRPHPDQSNKA